MSEHMGNGKRPYLRKLDKDRNRAKIAAYHNRHRGDRCFIIGNGPSLKHTDLSLLRDETTFGMNKIFLNIGKMGYMPTYMVLVNPLVIAQSIESILRMDVPKFVGHEGLKFLPIRDDIIYFMAYSRKHYFAETMKKNIWQGGTVTYCAMQIAYFMGFEEVILVGVDHHYVSNGEPNQEVVAEGKDLNHFHSGYFSNGMRWQLPDLKTSEEAYVLAREAFERRGGRIVDATIGGRLKVFDKIRYADALN